MKSKKVNIEIRGNHGKTNIPALSFGEFAYHKMVDYNRYAVTHVNSGMCVKQWIFIKSDARQFAISCELLGVKWDGRGDMPDDFSNSIKSLLVI